MFFYFLFLDLPPIPPREQNSTIFGSVLQRSSSNNDVASAITNNNEVAMASAISSITADVSIATPDESRLRTNKRKSSPSA